MEIFVTREKAQIEHPVEMEKAEKFPMEEESMHRRPRRSSWKN